MLLLGADCVGLARLVGDLLGVVPDDLVDRVDPVNLVLEHREVVGVGEPGLAHLAGVVELEGDPDALFRSLAPVAFGVTVEYGLEHVQVGGTRAGDDLFDVAESNLAVEHVLDAKGQGHTNHGVPFICRGMRLYMIAHFVLSVNT